MKTNLVVAMCLALVLLGGSASAWYEDYEHRIPLEIDNAGHPALTDYQFNISIPDGINESSIRVVNETVGTTVPHWCENETGGLCYELWFNTSVGSEVNTDYYIYYGNDSASSTSDYDDVFTKKYSDSGLVLELHMDEGTGTQANDTSGEDNHGTMHNMATPNGWQGTDGGQWDSRDDMVFADGDHLSFDGTGDYVDCGNDARLDIGTGDFSISAWVKQSNITGSRSVVSKRYTGYGNGYRFAIIDGTIRIEILDVGSTVAAYGNSALTMDQWYHIAGVIDRDGDGIVYIDGVAGTPVNFSGISGNLVSDRDLAIGKMNNYDGSYFNGSIDQVRIYNRAMSEDEVYRQYIRSKYAVDAPVVTMTDPYVNITLHSSYPVGDLQTDYTGIVKLDYIVESNFPLNHSSLAFLWGLNHTPTSDMHSYLKVPANSIAADGIYRAHNRNTTPYLSWEGNGTITEGNVWQWNGGDNDSFWISKESINATHTWINVSGETTNMFPSMFYLGRGAMYAAPKTGFEINKVQGIIMKIWDLEQFRGRSNDYYISLFFDTGLEATPSGNIELWYCNDSFDPDTHDPKEYCDYKESWDGTRWTTHRDYQPHTNVSFCEPLTISADISSCSCPPTEVNYLYLYSNTVSSKSYILNATNHDPGICNLTFAQTNTMWTFDEVSKTSTPVAYTPSIFQLFTRDYTSMDFQLYIANDQDVWGHSGIDNKSVGISDVTPTHCRYNYFWWDNTTDYNMTNLYTDDFYVNVTYGFDPDNGASLTHILSLYTSEGAFVATVNDTLTGNATEEDIFFNVDDYTGNYQFRIVSTDNEGSTSTTWSPVFTLSRGTDEEIPLNLFIVLMVLMFGSLFYIYHAETYISKIVTSLITTWMSFMLASMIVSGTVVLNYAELSSADAFVYGSYSIQIASLSHFFMFTGVVSALFMLTFTIKLVIDIYLDMQERRTAEDEWDGVEEQ